MRRDPRRGRQQGRDSGARPRGWARVRGSGLRSQVPVVKAQQHAAPKTSLKTRLLDGALPGSRRAAAAAAEAGRDPREPGAPRLGSGPRGRGGGTSGSLETREGDVCAPCARITPSRLSATADARNGELRLETKVPCPCRSSWEGRSPRTCTQRQFTGPQSAPAHSGGGPRPRTLHSAEGRREHTHAPTPRHTAHGRQK